jgi:hypothetical protein
VTRDSRSRHPAEPVRLHIASGDHHPRLARPSGREHLLEGVRDLLDVEQRDAELVDGLAESLR